MVKLGFIIPEPRVLNLLSQWEWKSGSCTRSRDVNCYCLQRWSWFGRLHRQCKKKATLSLRIYIRIFFQVGLSFFFVLFPTSLNKIFKPNIKRLLWLISFHRFMYSTSINQRPSRHQACSRWLDTLVNKPAGDPWPWNFRFLCWA